MPPNAWGQVSPQSRGPSSQAGGQGFGTNPPAKVGGTETSSVAVILFYISHINYVHMGLILNEIMRNMARLNYYCFFYSCVYLDWYFGGNWWANWWTAIEFCSNIIATGT